MVSSVLFGFERKAEKGGFMMQTPGFFKRLVYALAVLVRFVFDGKFAAPVLRLWEGESLELLEVDGGPERRQIIDKAPEKAPEPPSVAKVASDESSALQLLTIFQREGRLIDFLQEDIASYDDTDVGAAARLVHEGCRKALEQYVPVEPLRADGEGASIIVEKGFDASAIRLTGNVAGEPPFTGALRHHGWRVTEMKLPTLSVDQDARVIAPAEVEL